VKEIRMKMLRKNILIDVDEIEEILMDDGNDIWMMGIDNDDDDDDEHNEYWNNREFDDDDNDDDNHFFDCNLKGNLDDHIDDNLMEIFFDDHHSWME